MSAALGFLLLASYLAGSFPTSIVVTRLFLGVDVRKHGSGNAGATNVLRVAGWRAALPVALVDVLKGFAPAAVALWGPWDPEMSRTLAANLCGAAAVLGHVFPIWAGFRGGKGIGTSAGALLALHPAAVAAAVLPFAAALAGTRSVSAGSISASLALPILVVLLRGGGWAGEHHAEFLLLFPWSLALVLFHWKNILRLLEGRENRIF